MLVSEIVKQIGVNIRCGCLHTCIMYFFLQNWLFKLWDSMRNLHVIRYMLHRCKNDRTTQTSFKHVFEFPIIMGHRLHHRLYAFKLLWLLFDLIQPLPLGNCLCQIKLKIHHSHLERMPFKLLLSSLSTLHLHMPAWSWSDYLHFIRLQQFFSPTKKWSEM